MNALFSPITRCTQTVNNLELRILNYKNGHSESLWKIYKSYDELISSKDTLVE